MSMYRKTATGCAFAVLVLNLSAGEAAATLYDSHISIMKRAPCAEPVDEFVFVGDLGSFTLTKDQTHEFVNFPPATYTVTEVVEADWELVQIGIQTDDPNDTSTVTAAGDGVVLDVDDGETLFVTFTNEPIPEPATLGLLALGGVALLRRRK